MWKWVVMVLLLVTTFSVKGKAQANELAQLALNIEKLAQLKSILKTLKNGYDIVSRGYTAVKDISEGNFSLHKTFLDGLMQVSPAVRKYKKVAGIIDYQVMLIREYKRSYQRLKDTKLFNIQELAYMGSVYENLVSRSLKNLEELALVITSGQLSMSDDERFAAIDRIYAEMEDKVMFLRHFNGSASVLALQRGREQKDTEAMIGIYGLDN